MNKFRYRKELGFAAVFVVVGILYFISRLYYAEDIELIPMVMAIVIFVLVVVSLIVYWRMY